MGLTLGTECRDKVSGWTGILTARYEYMNGCVRYEISRSKSKKDGGEPKAFVFDEQQIEYVSDGVRGDLAQRALSARRTGGPRDTTPAPR